MTMRLHSLSFLLVLLFLYLPGLLAAQDTSGPLSGYKIICIWTIEARDPQTVGQTVAQARALGFNAVCWESRSVTEVPAACHRQGLKAFAIFNPLERRPDARLQVLAPGEERLAGYRRDSIPPEQFYQYGGEPADSHREILDQNFACPNDSGIVAWSLKQAAAAREAGNDGVILDFVGYRNYRSCECPVCLERLGEFGKKHPELSRSRAANLYYGNVLVTLYDTLYRAIKSQAPGLTVANHIHPVFLPDIFYGLKVRADLCGITVSWFFQPFWPLEKVREYTRRVVDGPYAHAGADGMPMIGIYTDGAFLRDRKPPARLRQELRILKQTNARHVIVCELGHILRDSETAEVIREELGGR
jgi:hypothetical protein